MTVRIFFSFLVMTSVLVFATSLAADDLEVVPERPEAENFSLIDLNGKTHQLSDYAGSVVLVTFWATWCPQCIWEMPLLSSLSKELGNENFIVLAVNVGEQRQMIRNFVDQHAVDFPVLLDSDLSTYKKWPVLGVPTSFVINPNGRIAYSVVGAIEWLNPATLSRIENLLPSNISQIEIRRFNLENN